MAYDTELADRIRALLADVTGVAEIPMFGGLCFTVNGNMALGPIKDVCMFRIGPDAYAEALAGGVAHELDVTGRPMRGMVQIPVSDLDDDRVLADWVTRGVDFAGSLPRKRHT